MKNKNHPAQTHDLPQEVANTFVEIIPSHSSQPSIYILNIYSPPSASLKEIDTLLQEFNNVWVRASWYSMITIFKREKNTTTDVKDKDKRKLSTEFYFQNRHI